jgi:hypothetical protein
VESFSEFPSRNKAYREDAPNKQEDYTIVKPYGNIESYYSEEPEWQRWQLLHAGVDSFRREIEQCWSQEDCEEVKDNRGEHCDYKEHFGK